MFMLNDALVVDTDTSPAGIDPESGRPFGGEPRAYVLVGREVVRCKMAPEFVGPAPAKGDFLTAEVRVTPWSMNGRHGVSVTVVRRLDEPALAQVS